MDTHMILDYLTELSANNNREWYHAHKAEYQAANAQFEGLIQALMLRIGEFDGSILGHAPKELGKLPIPVGYYIMLKPGGQSFLGGGLFADMFKDATRMVRDHISEHGSEWEGIITAPAFQECFTVSGTALKNVPAGYEKNHPQ